ncbi:hypothetical protein Anas_05996 [Armadillidium nasatum]|uniref:Uncharacterized protein n=1 Tax=Armadillidium nasatum TaxID=96803 RepID=A0A5N5T819_9CRUS|nr:hypothetical protein Anas_05996 [Armadillidium nasatum]
MGQTEFVFDESRNSLVENDVDNVTLSPEILQSLNKTDQTTTKKDHDPLETTMVPVSCSDTLDKKFCTTEQPFADDKNLDIKPYRHPRNVKRTSVLTAQNKISFWMSHKSDKYLTELAFLNPFSYDKLYMIHLGIYIATFYNYGDHVVQQDRLVKVNGFNVTCWSHATLANFFLHLPHNDQNRFDDENKMTKFTITLEFLRKRERISVGSTSVNPVTVTYLNRTSCSLLKLGSSTNRYIKIEEVNVDQSRWTSSGRTVLRVTEGERLLGERNAQITFHEFDISPRNEPGKIVAMEVFREGVFLHAGNSTAGTSLSLMSENESSSLRNITSSESRLFRVFSNEGNILSKIIHIQSGLYLKAENGVVSLSQSPVTNSMMFRIFQC